MAQGRPLPMALHENRIWGVRSGCLSVCFPGAPGSLTTLVRDAHVVDGIVKAQAAVASLLAGRPW